jgi:hypothetical protein
MRKMRHLTFALLALYFSSSIAAQSPSDHPAKKPFWTPAEEKQYQACLPLSLKTWKTRKEAEDYCLLDEEHKRWMRHHPEARTKAEDKVKWQECIAAKREKFNNGTREEVRAIYNECQSKTYGLKP